MVADHGIKHLRQFREDIDGNRSAVFPDGRATVVIDGRRYEVRTANGELWTAGKRGLDEAVERIEYAQSGTEIYVTDPNGQTLPLGEYRKIVAPVIFRVYYTMRERDPAIFIAMEAVRNGRKFTEWLGKNVDIPAAIADTMRKQARHGVKNHEIHWGRSPLPGFRDEEGRYIRHDFPHLVKRANAEKDKDEREYFYGTNETDATDTETQQQAAG